MEEDGLFPVRWPVDGQPLASLRRVGLEHRPQWVQRPGLFGPKREAPVQIARDAHAQERRGPGDELAAVAGE
ncbi:MAG: hypothetical protein HYY04_13200 [Chloroflexi bacterium]|nr:hypothetical protein [Chloroflexota bacterium]